MNCAVCGHAMVRAFEARVLSRHQVSFHHCEQCGFLCTEKPYWLAEAYQSAIASSDTGAIARNLRIAQKLSGILYFAFGDRGGGKWLDYGGGHGVLARLMRDRGFDFYWHDPHAENLFTRGFEHREDQVYDGVTAIEVLEHMADPMAFFAAALGKARTRTLIVTTETYAGPPPAPQAWWYYGLDTGQHIAFFQRRTLKLLAEHFGLRYVPAGNLHLFAPRSLHAGALKLACGPLAPLCDRFVRLRLNSRTQSDHEKLARS
jgi:methyltransferase family protein